MFSDPYDRLYDKIKDMKLEITDRCDGKVFDYPLEDLVKDCIELQQTGGRGYLFTLDMVFYMLENRIWWVDPAELVFELVKQHAWVDYDENSNPLRVYLREKQCQISQAEDPIQEMAKIRQEEQQRVSHRSEQ